jgi:hypothetical protein
MAERGLVEAEPIWTIVELTGNLDEPTAHHRWQFATVAQTESWIDFAEAGKSDIDWPLTIRSDWFRFLWLPASRLTTDARHPRLALTLSEELIDFHAGELLQQSRPRQWTPRAKRR